MVFRDATGKVLAEGDQVVFALAYGNTAIVPIVKMESGLGAQGAESQPKIYLSLLVPVVVGPTGVAPVIKVADKPTLQ